MAYSFVTSSFSFIPSLMLVLFLSFAISSSYSRTVQVSDICSKHENPTYCETVLNTVTGGAGGTASVDLDSISLSTITLADVKAFNILSLIDDKLISTQDPQLKQRYRACSMSYGDVLDYLPQAKKSCSSGDYKGMHSAVDAAMKDVADCGSKPPTYDPSPLPMDNKEMQDTITIIVILADFLTGKY